MTLAVVGSGLVSPFGLTPRDHVLFLRARLPGPAASPFRRDDDSRVDVHFCPLVDVRAAFADRLAALAEGALAEALAPLAEADLPPPALFLCMARARPGLDDRVHREVEQAIVARRRVGVVARFWGEAGAFAALPEVEAHLERQGGAAALVAVDSHVSLEWLTDRVLHPRSRWVARPPTPSEGAGALVLMRPEEARDRRLPSLGAVLESALAVGAANDDNDEPADAVAMSQALRALGSFPVHAAFGQGAVDALRRDEWFRAVARNAARFRHGCQHECLEGRIGAVGAAAGAMSLSYGLAALRHDILDLAGPRTDPFVAWAISRDGTRGAAAVRAEVA